MRPSLRLAVLASLATCASLAFAASAWATTSVYTVASQADTGGTCTATPINCTLRQAINTANGDGTDSEIDFNITTGSGLHPIFPLSPLPTITAAVTIDGTTQSDSHLVEVGGSVMPQPLYANTDGFVVTAANVTIKGLDIQDFVRDGIQVLAGSDTITGNVIVANARNGIYVGSGAITDTISNNNIGRATGTPGVPNGGASGTPSGNGHDGIAFDNAGSSTVPTIISVSGNVIANNANNGVGVFNSGAGSSAPGGIQLWSNNFYEANGGLGIDLGDNGVVTPNDSLDSDGGPNSQLNYPVLTSAVASGGHTTVDGTYAGSAGSGLTVYLYSSTSCDPSGYGEGGTIIGSPVSVNTDGSGHDAFSDSTSPSLPAGTFVTALAVNTAGDTSEFSNCVRVPGAPSATTGDASAIGTNGATLNATVNPDSADTSVHFEYGPTSSYGSSTGPQSAGSDASDHAVAQAISGIGPGQTVHYRVVATNSQSTVSGGDREFTTTTPPPSQTTAAQNTLGAGIITGGGGKSSPRCVVPKLGGKKLADIKKALARAHCKLGKVKKAKKHGRKKGTALAQSVRVGAQKPAGAKVNVTLVR